MYIDKHSNKKREANRESMDIENLRLIVISNCDQILNDLKSSPLVNDEYIGYLAEFLDDENKKLLLDVESIRKDLIPYIQKRKSLLLRAKTTTELFQVYEDIMNEQRRKHNKLTEIEKYLTETARNGLTKHAIGAD